MAGAITDNEAITDLAGRYERLCTIWDKARATAREAVA
jgi:5-dehydro-2-deoxygluconokinase